MNLGAGASCFHIRLGRGGADVNVIGRGSRLTDLLFLFCVIRNVASHAFGLFEEQVVDIC